MDIVTDTIRSRAAVFEKNATDSKDCNSKMFLANLANSSFKAAALSKKTDGRSSNILTPVSSSLPGAIVKNIIPDPIPHLDDLGNQPPTDPFHPTIQQRASNVEASTTPPPFESGSNKEQGKVQRIISSSTKEKKETSLLPKLAVFEKHAQDSRNSSSRMYLANIVTTKASDSPMKMSGRRSSLTINRHEMKCMGIENEKQNRVGLRQPTILQKPIQRRASICAIPRGTTFGSKVEVGYKKSREINTGMSHPYINGEMESSTTTVRLQNVDSEQDDDEYNNTDRSHVHSIRSGIVQGKVFDRADLVLKAEKMNRRDYPAEDENDDTPRHPINSLRPGVMRGTSFDQPEADFRGVRSPRQETETGTNGSDNDEVVEEDEVEYRPPPRYAEYSLRPGVIHGKSFDRSDAVFIGERLAPYQDDDTARHPINGLRPGVMRGTSFDRPEADFRGVRSPRQETETGTNGSDNDEVVEEDEVEYRPPPRYAQYSLRPGVIRGKSFDRSDAVFIGERLAPYQDDDTARHPINSLRPGVMRGTSFDRPEADFRGVRSPRQETETGTNGSDNDEVVEEDEVEYRPPPRYAQYSLRPGVIRGKSFDRSDAVFIGERLAPYQDDDTARHPINSLRPGVMRGTSFDRPEADFRGVRSPRQETETGTNGSDNDEVVEEDEVEYRPPPRYAQYSLRPGVIRGKSFDRSDAVFIGERLAPYQDDDTARHPINGLRPGVMRGTSFDRPEADFRGVRSPRQETETGTNGSDNDEVVEEDEVEYRPPPRYAQYSLRPGVIRGKSFDRSDAVFIGERLAPYQDDDTARHPINGLRPGVMRGTSFDRPEADFRGVRSPRQETETGTNGSDNDDEGVEEDEVEYRPPPRYAQYSLRPGVIRGKSFDRSDAVFIGERLAPY